MGPILVAKLMPANIEQIVTNKPALPYFPLPPNILGHQHLINQKITPQIDLNHFQKAFAPATIAFSNFLRPAIGKEIFFFHLHPLHPQHLLFFYSIFASATTCIRYFFSAAALAACAFAFKLPNIPHLHHHNLSLNRNLIHIHYP